MAESRDSSSCIESSLMAIQSSLAQYIIPWNIVTTTAFLIYLISAETEVYCHIEPEASNRESSSHYGDVDPGELNGLNFERVGISTGKLHSGCSCS